MNSVNLVGRLTKDIQIRSTMSGKSVAEFTLAVDRHTKDKQADFIPCVAWEKTAELLSNYTKKGDQLSITGSIQTGSYDDPIRPGQKVYTVKVLVSSIGFLGKKEKEKPNTAFDTVDDMAESLEVNSDYLPF